MIIIDKNKKYYIIAVLVLVIICVLAGYYFGSRSVHDNSLGADAVRNELETSQRLNQDLRNELERANARLDTATTEVAESRNITDRIADRAKDNDRTIGTVGKLIDESESIIENVRKRNEKENTNT